MNPIVDPCAYGESAFDYDRVAGMVAARELGADEQPVRPVDRFARHVYDALKSIEAARRVLQEDDSHPYPNTAAVTLREAWHTLDRRLAETADYRPNAGGEGREAYPAPACSVSVCGETLGPEGDPRPHACDLPKGHGGPHHCRVCWFAWHTPNAPVSGGAPSPQVAGSVLCRQCAAEQDRSAEWDSFHYGINARCEACGREGLCAMMPHGRSQP